MVDVQNHADKAHEIANPPTVAVAPAAFAGAALKKGNLGVKPMAGAPGIDSPGP